jgi:hypothetical protein
MRFDLIKRAEFFGFYLEHKELWEENSEAFIDLVNQEQIITYWHPRATSQRYREFMRVEQPWTEKRIEGRSRRLVGRNCALNVSLYHSIVDGGWDPRWPVRLKKMMNPQPPVSGRPLTNNITYSDGQHRLMVLIHQGQRMLRPEQYVIAEITSPFDPLEITDCYIRHGLCTEAEFCDFARWRFPVPKHITDVKTLYTWGMDTEVAPWWERYMRDYWQM